MVKATLQARGGGVVQGPLMPGDWKQAAELFFQGATPQKFSGFTLYYLHSGINPGGLRGPSGVLGVEPK